MSSQNNNKQGGQDINNKKDSDDIKPSVSKEDLINSLKNDELNKNTTMDQNDMKKNENMNIKKNEVLNNSNNVEDGDNENSKFMNKSKEGLNNINGEKNDDNNSIVKVEESPKSIGYNYYASESIENLCKEFGLESINTGLNSEQVKINRDKYGENFIEKDEVVPVWLIFLSQYCSPVVLLLLVAAVASLALNEVVEGVAIISIVTLNACLATYMEKSSGDAIGKLAEMASPQCTVLRNGQKVVIPSREVVVGDVVLINTGDSISADLRLFDVIELKTNESLLTGESEDIKKTIVADNLSTPFATNLCFATTSVTSGSGKGIVISTGLDTQVGKIASQLKKSSKGSKLTPLQVALNKLGGLIGLIAIIVLVVIISLAVIIKYRDPAHADKDPTFVIIIIGVGFAVSSIPEGLPMVVTITLSAGAKDMVKKKCKCKKTTSC